MTWEEVCVIVLLNVFQQWCKFYWLNNILTKKERVIMYKVVMKERESNSNFYSPWIKGIFCSWYAFLNPIGNHSFMGNLPMFKHFMVFSTLQKKQISLNQYVLQKRSKRDLDMAASCLASFLREVTGFVEKKKKKW